MEPLEKEQSHIHNTVQLNHVCNDDGDDDDDDADATVRVILSAIVAQHFTLAVVSLDFILLYVINSQQMRSQLHILTASERRFDFQPRVNC